MASKAMSVAAYFIGAVNRDEGDVMTHLRLQKLLYYAQGFSLAILDRPLFDDEIQAWNWTLDKPRPSRPGGRGAERWLNGHQAA